ncbi:MAG: hypothetical protein AAGF06_06270 [Pseudomonadota bacterium]
MAQKWLIATISIIAIISLGLTIWPSTPSDTDITQTHRTEQSISELDSTETVAAIQAQNWYEGGSLHQKSANDWVGATIENKLATASDWVAAFPKIKTAYAASNDMNLLKPFALALVECLDQVHMDNPDTPLTQLVANCALDMEWN